MLNKEQLQTIEKEARHLLEKLGAPGDVRIEQIEGLKEPTVQVTIQVEEPKIIIGEKGQTLFEVQHILKLMLRKKIEEPFYLSLDVNEYKKNKEEYLRDLAKTTADEVILLKKPKELSPMPASERRIIHMALAERTDVTSESVGEGAERRVVIKLKT
ncbi:MAG: R3H domain-containing nucleic acid-binding protein [Patescibacteria group bacterium]